MKKPSRNAKRRGRLIAPTLAQDKRINAGLKADPDTFELRGKDFAQMKPMPDALLARMSMGLTQGQFARMLEVSVRTLQEWEQHRREPTGAARTLLAIASRRPDVLRELFAG